MLAKEPLKTPLNGLGDEIMFWLFYNYPPKYPIQKKIWIKIRFIHETSKAILVYCNEKKIWIPKSRIYKLRLREGVFEVYVEKNVIG